MYTSKVHLLHIRRNERTPASVTSLCKAKKAPVLRQAPLLLVRVTGPEARAPGRRLRPLTRLHGVNDKPCVPCQGSTDIGQ